MMTRTIKAKLCWLLCLSFVFATGCRHNSASQSPLIAKNLLLGKWQRLDVKARSIEFRENGTTVSTVVLSDRVLTKPGTYKIVDASRVSLAIVAQPNVEPKEVVAEYNISGNRLTMKYPNKLTLDFERVK